MQLHSFETAKEFLRDVERDLAHKEVEHHLLLGATYRLIAESANGRATFAAVRDDDGLALAAVMTPPYPLVVVSDRTDASAAIDCLVRWLSERGILPRDLFVSVGHADPFVKAWQRTTGGCASVRLRQREYVLRALAPVRIGPGSLRAATVGDMELLERWTRTFHTEAMRESAVPELRKRIELRVELGEIFLWEDGDPRSMAASARPTRRGIAVNNVFTPEEWRGRGYATACVAKLSELLLEQGREFCVLYTDLANPTSNSIYTRIGYRPVTDFTMMALSAESSSR